MGHILKNQNLEVHIDPPFEKYRGARFDWTGKITELKFKGVALTTGERPATDPAASGNPDHFGKGLYNEFGIDSALGFDEAAQGEWFHKIGVGLLKKDGAHYQFDRNYVIDPAKFQVGVESGGLRIRCQSKAVNGYCYTLIKSIVLEESGFVIGYELKNTGEKPIHTTEYNHNFLAFARAPVGPGCNLKFPFSIRPATFGETVNPEGKVVLAPEKITFNGTPHEPFFFSNLSGNASVKAHWNLTDLRSQLALSETGDFLTDRIHLWGWGHVISPELFHTICLLPGQTTSWLRRYRVEKLGQDNIAPG